MEKKSSAIKEISVQNELPVIKNLTVLALYNDNGVNLSLFGENHASKANTDYMDVFKEIDMSDTDVIIEACDELKFSGKYKNGIHSEKLHDMKDSMKSFYSADCIRLTSGIMRMSGHLDALLIPEIINLPESAAMPDKIKDLYKYHFEDRDYLLGVNKDLGDATPEIKIYDLLFSSMLLLYLAPLDSKYIDMFYKNCVVYCDLHGEKITNLELAAKKLTELSKKIDNLHQSHFSNMTPMDFKQLLISCHANLVSNLIYSIKVFMKNKFPHAFGGGGEFTNTDTFRIMEELTKYIIPAEEYYYDKYGVGAVVNAVVDWDIICEYMRLKSSGSKNIMVFCGARHIEILKNLLVLFELEPHTMIEFNKSSTLDYAGLIKLMYSRGVRATGGYLEMGWLPIFLIIVCLILLIYVVNAYFFNNAHKKIKYNPLR
jgi:hypothetical protein